MVSDWREYEPLKKAEGELAKKKLRFREVEEDLPKVEAHLGEARLKFQELDALGSVGRAEKKQIDGQRAVVEQLEQKAKELTGERIALSGDIGKAEFVVKATRREALESWVQKQEAAQLQDCEALQKALEVAVAANERLRRRQQLAESLGAEAREHGVRWALEGLSYAARQCWEAPFKDWLSHKVAVLERFEARRKGRAA